MTKFNITGSSRKKISNASLSAGFLIFLIGIFAFLNSSFLSLGNLRAIELSAAILLVAACGVSFVILMGSIDLSTGPTVSLAGMLVTALLPKLGYSALLIGPALGLLIGLLNGMLFVFARIPSIITTLGTGTALSGLVFFVSDGQSIPVYDDFIQQMTLAGPIQVLPSLIIYAMLIYGLCIFIDERTSFGRTVLAIGGDERVATLLGAQVDRSKILAFTISGFLAGVTGVLLASRLGTAASQMGTYLTLDAITAAVVGGVSILGGRGGIRNVLAGVLIIAVLSNGMNILSLHPYLQTIIKGVIIVLAVLFTSIRPSAEDVK